MRAALTLLSLAWIGGTALAQVNPPARSDQPPANAAVGKPVAEKHGKRRARAEKAAAKRAQPQKSDSDALATLASCVQLWEPATHMTRREWTHACRRVADRLTSTALQ